MSQKVAIYRKESFNAAHRLYNPSWDEKTNEQVFGKCALPNYHGHNYDLVVKLTGYPDASTGYVMDTKVISDLVENEIVNRFDHRNLNLDCPEFATINPTVENIAIVIFNILRPLIDEKLELQIRLYETHKNFVDYPA
jgi:6-pyruvoyltetrahydropterin/6-carboxytetrahydropterin synthase